MASTLQQWLGEQVVPLFLIGFAVLMGFAMVYISARSRRSSLARDRSGQSEDTFSDYLAAYGFDPNIARLTYRYLQENKKVSFPIDPQDDLESLLGLDEEDVQSTVRDLLQATEREYLPGLLESPLVTVVDIVRYIQASPRRLAVVRRRTA